MEQRQSSAKAFMLELAKLYALAVALKLAAVFVFWAHNFEVRPADLLPIVLIDLMTALVPFVPGAAAYALARRAQPDTRRQIAQVVVGITALPLLVGVTYEYLRDWALG